MLSSRARGGGRKKRKKKNTNNKAVMGLKVSGKLKY